jgi:hypothetical protein
VLGQPALLLDKSWVIVDSPDDLAYAEHARGRRAELPGPAVHFIRIFKPKLDFPGRVNEKPRCHEACVFEFEFVGITAGPLETNGKQPRYGNRLLPRLGELSNGLEIPARTLFNLCFTVSS